MPTNFFNGSTDLGPAREMFAAYAHFDRLSPGCEYDAIHGSLHAVLAERKDLDAVDLQRLASRSREFRSAFDDELSEHERWILTQLETTAHELT